MSSPTQRSKVRRGCTHKAPIWARFNPEKNQYEWLCEKCGKTVRVITALAMATR